MQGRMEEGFGRMEEGFGLAVARLELVWLVVGVAHEVQRRGLQRKQLADGRRRRDVEARRAGDAVRDAVHPRRAGRERLARRRELLADPSDDGPAAPVQAADEQPFAMFADQNTRRVLYR